MPTASLSITPTPPPSTLWGTIQTIAQAEYAPAPDIVVDQGDVLTAWVGADNERIFHALRRWRDDIFDTVVIPVVPSHHPFEQRIFPAEDDGYHLLWLDTNPDTTRIQLYSAYINSELVTIIAPDSLSSQQTTHYTAVSDIQDALWVVWSGGLLAEPALYVVRLDGLGRPLFPEALTLDGDYPVFARRLDNALYLFWISRVNQRVMRAEFIDGELFDTRPISTLPQLSAGDRLTDFSAIFDRTHQTLFWNITREDGVSETYYASSPIESSTTAQPAPMTIAVDTGKTVQTGFNSGVVNIAASRGSNTLAWANPLNEPADIAPIAVQNGDAIGIAYLQGGAIIGYQRIVQTGRLLGQPVLRADRDRHLYLTWSQPTPYGVSNLNLTTTR